MVLLLKKTTSGYNGRSRCQADGGDLTTTINEEEYNFVVSVLSRYGSESGFPRPWIYQPNPLPLRLPMILCPAPLKPEFMILSYLFRSHDLMTPTMLRKKMMTSTGTDSLPQPFQWPPPLVIINEHLTLYETIFVLVSEVWVEITSRFVYICGSHVTRVTRN